VKDVLRSLKTRNYRLYFSGQVVSLMGTWMQIFANGWLVLKLTNSGFAVGLASALQFGPMLFGGVWGGWLADRFPKRKMLILTQSLFLVQATVLGVLTFTRVVDTWMVYSLILFYGMVQVADIPARQAFVSEMVKKEDVMNAVGLNSAVFNGARMIGPTFAGFFIAFAKHSSFLHSATPGAREFMAMGICFWINAATYLAVLIGLALMRDSELVEHGGERPEGRGQIRAGLTYVRQSPVLLLTLLLMTVVGTLALNFQIVMPLLARYTFHGDTSTYALLTLPQAAGAFGGAMFAATRRIPSMKLLVFTGLAFGATMIGVALAPTLHSEFIALPLMGAAAMVFISTTNTMLQITAAPEMRGRVLALWSLVFLGSTPIGGPVVGWICQVLSPRWGLGVGGIATLAATIAFGPFLLRIRTHPVATEDEEAEALEVGVETVAAGQKT
jgi:MFS family permease